VTARARVAAATWRVLFLAWAGAVGAAPAVGAESPAAPPAPPVAPDAARAATAAEREGFPSPAHGPDVVEMTVVGRVADYQRLIAPIGARTPGGVPLLWNRIDRFNPLAELLRSEPAATQVALRCWIDLSDLKRATLYFASRGGERFLVRELALSGRLDEVDQQSLAQVLEISIAALLENQDNGLTRAEARAILARAQAAAPPVAPAPRAARTWFWGLSASYAIEAIAASAPVGQGPGVVLSLSTATAPASPSAEAAPPPANVPGDPTTGARAPRAPTGPYLGAWLSGHYRMPETARAPEISARFEALALRAGVAAGWGRLSVRAGGGRDWTHVTPQASAGGAAVMLTAPHWSAGWLLGGAVAARLPVDRIAGLDRVALSLVLSLEALTAATDYEIQEGASDGAGSRVAFALRRARPAAAVELGFF
jgi:hypothetical protein